MPDVPADRAGQMLRDRLASLTDPAALLVEIERGLVAIIQRAFEGERISLPPLWYDIRQLRNLPPETDTSGGKRIAISAELVPIRDGAGVSYVLIVFNDETAAHLAREQAEVGHLRRLVDDLLDVSRITRGTLELALAHVDPSDAIGDGVEAARPLIDQRKQVLVVATPPGLYVHGDRGRLAQIITNLLTNAARYTEPGGRITVTARRERGMHVVVVRDTGVGMPAELVPRVFEIFTRGDRSIDRGSGGLGLGLAIVKSLTEKHGGSVVARSEGAGRGSELEIMLPASEPAPTAKIPAPSGKRSLRGRVLVVDDNVDAALLLAEAFEARGLTTSVAHDGASALELVRAQTPQIAVVDIGLPGMDGYDLASALHALPGCAALPIIALTGYGQPSDRLRSARAGFAAHFVKPVSLETILIALDLYL